jgi:SAM-dependent methyltransferase
MSNVRLVDPRQIWNERFARSRERGFQHTYEPWLDRWADVLATTGELPVLDLGCGSGYDSQYLTAKGYRVIAADFACEGLRVARDIAAQAELVEMDIRKGIPFPEGAFQAIVANLSLHYYRWRETQVVLREVRNRLRNGGYLLARVNSTRDRQHGATSGEIVERHCRIVAGVLKRFYDREDLAQLFGDGWVVEGLAEQVAHCYGRPKVLWEIVARRV